MPPAQLPNIPYITEYLRLFVNPYRFRNTHFKGAKPQITNPFPILKPIYLYMIVQYTWLYQLQEALHVCEHMYMYVCGIMRLRV